MTRGGLKNYSNKMRALALMQSSHDELKGYIVICPLSGETIKPCERVEENVSIWYDANKGLYQGKLDFAHIISRTHHNVKNYPYFIDSLLNGVMALHEAHISSNKPNYPYSISEKQAYMYNAFMDINSNVPFNCDINLRSKINSILNAHQVDDLHTIENAILIIKSFTEVE